ncbi:MAG: DNA adenine methylase [Sulfurimonas sp.]|uniref:DNA adenine methylase n=1 Tax=Sulfurimonas sp. TaxID=2022749 RepID=UPI00261A1AEA|nr:DNA adenine methylase [Sulfurimonas sp.]MDD5401108.1 DNA adenine methylase [Sulfurimonas sp.]
MIERYLGNKSSIINHIMKEVDKLCNKGDYVCDIFSGTLSVSINLKKSGYRVISNDINRFSYCFGRSHLIANNIPKIDFESLGIDYNLYAENAIAKVKLIEKGVGYNFLNDKKEENSYVDLIVLLTYLDSISEKDIDPEHRKSFFFDYYTEEGKYSKFVSQRGSEGNRKFFTPSNGSKIDLYLNKIREWHKNNLLLDDLYYLLLSTISESVEKVSNTQGTFHDFPRTKYDSRAFKKLELRAPKFDNILSDIDGHILGKERDSMEFIKEVPSHKLLYIDPPYNFRQYTSYYFMLNLICDYCEIPDLNKYFNEVKYVRGQNMDKNFISSFCKNSEFISSLQKLIENADTEWIVMSYFNGRNHKSATAGDKGTILNELEQFFQTDLFESNSLKIKPIKRKNYQSYGGHKALEVNELLYIVKKRMKDEMV